MRKRRREVRMKKLKLKKIGLNWFENMNFNKCMNLTMYLVFALVSVILIKTIVNQFIPAKPSPPVISRGSVMLISYWGLPFALWFFIGIGLMFGLAFHGFKLFNIHIEKRECDGKHFKNKR